MMLSTMSPLSLSLSDELLLKAAMLPQEQAAKAWIEWQNTFDLNLINSNQTTLLPMIYHHLRVTGVLAPYTEKLKGIYRFYWLNNQLLFNGVKSILEVFLEKGISVNLIKGSALASYYYKEVGLRGMSDFDVLVSPEQAIQAVKILIELGWECVDVPYEKVLNKNYLSVSHSQNFQKRMQGKIVSFDLHWYPLSEYIGKNTRNFLNQTSLAVTFKELNVYTFSPTEHLFHVCVHGFFHNYSGAIRWLADILVIMNHSAEHIDWLKLAARIKADHLALPFYKTFYYLRATFDAAIPDYFLQQLKQMEIKPSANREHYWKTTVIKGTMLHVFMNAWHIHTRAMQFASLPQTIMAFPQFLQYLTCRKKLWHLPFYGMLIASKRLQARLRLKFSKVTM